MAQKNWRIEDQRRSENAADLLFRHTTVVSVEDRPAGKGMEDSNWERPPQTLYRGWDKDGDELWGMYMDHRGEKPVILFFCPTAPAFHKHGVCHMCVEYVEEPGESPSHFTEMMKNCRIGEKPENGKIDGTVELPVCEACGENHYLGQDLFEFLTRGISEPFDAKKVGKA
jgi:hypothetical protein